MPAQDISGCKTSSFPKEVWHCPPATPRKPLRALDPGIMSKNVKLTHHSQTTQRVPQSSGTLDNYLMNNFKLPCSCLMCPYKIRAFHCTCGGISLPQAQKQMWDEQSTTLLSLVKIPEALLETNNSKNCSMFHILPIPRLMKLSLH